MLGSSSTYITPDKPLPIWLARRMRCASPPESVSAPRSRLGDLGLGADQLDRFKVRQRCGERVVLHLVDRLAARLVGVLQEHVARFAPQARAVAIGAGLGGLVAAEFFAHRHRIGFAQAAFKRRDDAFEGVLAFHHLGLGASRALGRVAERDRLFAAAVQHELLRFLG
jgi:hypothetical protein